MLFTYDVDFHFRCGDWDTYSVQADCIDHARFKAIRRLIDEASNRLYDNSVDIINIYRGGTDKLLKSYTIKERGAENG